MIKANSFPGSSTKDNLTYHDLPITEMDSHRKNTQMRVNLLKSVYDFNNKKGIDLGCNAGGFCFRLNNLGAKMTGVDYDSQTIEIAKNFNKKYSYDVNFVNQKIDLNFIKNISNYDFCIFLDTWMWIAKSDGFDSAKQVLREIYNKCKVMFFSTSQNDGMARNEIKCETDVYDLLLENTSYKIKNLGVVKDGWHPRSTFFCWRD